MGLRGPSGAREERMGWREGCASLRGQGSGGYLASRLLTVTVWL